MTQVQKELFIELTQKQCETVEGGLFQIKIEGLQAVTAGADLIGADETYITINGSKFWGDKKFSTGQYRTVDKSKSVDGSSARVNLFDDDWIGRDDSMGGFTAYNTNGALRIARVSGSGSTYDVYYKARLLPDW